MQAGVDQSSLALGRCLAADTPSPSADAARMNAMTLVAGVEPILTAAPSRGGDPLGGAWNFGDIGMPE